MHRFLLAAVLVLPSLAQAGSLSLSATRNSDVCPTVTAPAGGTTATRCITGSDAQLMRVLDAYAARAGLDPATATLAQKFDAFAQYLFREVKAAGRQRDADAARAAAEASVAPVDMQ